MMNVLPDNLFVGKSTWTVQKAMAQIDLNHRGIVVLTDEDNKLVGTLTDGDIRRFLLKGGSLSEPAAEAANLSPRVAMTVSEAEALYHSKNYVAIPIINYDRMLLDIYIGTHVKRVFPQLNLPVVINAGGKGTRLEPFTKILPKPLIPVGELPILELIMKSFADYGCTEFHIIVNYKKELIKAYFSESDKEYNISWYDEERPLGTGGGLTMLKGCLDRSFFFTSCDTLIRANYGSMVDYHREKKHVVTMVCAHKNVSIPYGVVEMTEGGGIAGFREKPSFSFLTNTGMYLIEPEVIDRMEDGVSIGFPDVVEKERLDGRLVGIFPITESDWMDMGQMDELEKMRKQLERES